MHRPATYSNTLKTMCSENLNVLLLRVQCHEEMTYRYVHQHGAR